MERWHADEVDVKIGSGDKVLNFENAKVKNVRIKNDRTFDKTAITTTGAEPMMSIGNSAHYEISIELISTEAELEVEEVESPNENQRVSDLSNKELLQVINSRLKHD